MKKAVYISKVDWEGWSSTTASMHIELTEEELVVFNKIFDTLKEQNPQAEIRIFEEK